jgi:hypothetical protein
MLAGSPGPAKVVGHNANVNVAIRGLRSEVSFLPCALVRLVVLLS